MPPIKQKIQPGPGRVVIMPLSPDQEVDVGNGTSLWVPRPATHEGVVGRIVDPGKPWQMGDGSVHEPNYITGNIVLIGKYTGMRITLNRTEEFILCKDQDIIGELVDIEQLPDSSQLSLENTQP